MRPSAWPSARALLDDARLRRALWAGCDDSRCDSLVQKHYCPPGSALLLCRVCVLACTRYSFWFHIHWFYPSRRILRFIDFLPPLSTDLLLAAAADTRLSYPRIPINQHHLQSLQSNCNRRPPTRIFYQPAALTSPIVFSPSSALRSTVSST